MEEQIKMLITLDVARLRSQLALLLSHKSLKSHTPHVKLINRQNVKLMNHHKLQQAKQLKLQPISWDWLTYGHRAEIFMDYIATQLLGCVHAHCSCHSLLMAQPTRVECMRQAIARYDEECCWSLIELIQKPPSCVSHNLYSQLSIFILLADGKRRKSHT